MTKVMRYENGKAIAGQVDAPFKVDWSDWINMTDAQKKGKKWLIENVPGAEGEIDAELFTPLWTNPNPTADFAAQAITLSSNDYDFLLCIAWSDNSGSRNIDMSTITNKGDHILFSSNDRYRTATYTSDTTYFFNNGYINGGTTRNGYCVPQIIYGFKKTVKIKFDALAKDVSTLASKCMLSDGETSVEDKLKTLEWKLLADGGSGSGVKTVSDMSIYNEVLLIVSNGSQLASTLLPRSLFESINISATVTINTSASAWTEGLCNITKTSNTTINYYARAVSGTVSWYFYAR